MNSFTLPFTFSPYKAADQASIFKRTLAIKQAVAVTFKDVRSLQGSCSRLKNNTTEGCFLFFLQMNLIYFERIEISEWDVGVSVYYY